MYEQGKVKVVRLKGDNRKIYSKMFDDENKALEYAKNIEDYIIFSLVSQQNMEEFEWKLLPYGRYKLYLKVIEMFNRNKKGIVKFVEGAL